MGEAPFLEYHKFEIKLSHPCILWLSFCVLCHVPYVMASMHDPEWISVWCHEGHMWRAGIRHCLLGLMMASTCCFMVTAGAVSLPFGPEHTFYHSFSISFCLIPFTVPLGFWGVFLLFPISHFLFLIVQQPFLNAFYSPSSFSILSLSGLRGSLPWCSFYGLQPQAPNLRWSGCMCFKRG